MRSILTLFFIAVLFAANAQQTDNYVDGELLVLVNHKVEASDYCEQLNRSNANFKLVQRLSNSLNLWRIQFDSEIISNAEALVLARANASTRFAQFNHTNIEVRNTPDDPDFDEQWAFYNDGTNGGSGTADIDALDAWDITTGGLTPQGDTIVVAVIDGGFNIEHEDLVANMFTNHQEIVNNIDDDGNGYVDDIHGWNVYSNSGTHSFDNHGTHVAGTVGARGDNGVGVTGVNWNVKVLPISGSSTLESTVIGAYGYALDMRRLYAQTNGAKGAYVVSTNSSFGVNFGNPNDYPLWCAMYDSLGYAGILSAGATINQNINVDVDLDVPTACSSDFLISVTNMTSSDVRNNFAGFGLETIDIGAPGTGIYSTNYTGYGSNSGTSMATPHVAGAIGLMYSAVCTEVMTSFNGDPAGLALYMKDKLLEEGVDELMSLDGIVSSGGRLNLRKAVESVSDSCLSIVTQIVNSSCGECSGSITLEMIGGVSPFEYHWSNIATSVSSQDSLCPGQYLVTVIDALGDSAVASMVISDSTGPNVSAVYEMISCNGGADGSIELNGGAFYTWNDGDTSAKRTDLEAGTYVVSATDGFSTCVRVLEIVLLEPQPISIQVEQTIPKPETASNGSIEVTANGGTPPYTFEWFDGDTDSKKDQLANGTYKLVITDHNGCMLDTTVVLGYPVGVQTSSASQNLRIYPNPTSGLLHFDSSSEIQELRVYDMLGRQVFSYSKGGNRTLQIDLGSLTSGVYTVTVISEEGRSQAQISLMK